ncbi:hypothetical protein AK812_SmicGene30563 [Symbiodinium microadriaticum]|uniref:Uncharacterized protein n=1 Tax=Symbiodinium microadriaticum TaxID=2951 RepID=A0A1Q9CZ23_SYMMI|nr:hypothetical protein AK812_SmicGene30563 [Symbiodinium microadriaticum]
MVVVVVVVAVVVKVVVAVVVVLAVAAVVDLCASKVPTTIGDPRYAAAQALVGKGSADSAGILLAMDLLVLHLSIEHLWNIARKELDVDLSNSFAEKGHVEGSNFDNHIRQSSLA